MKKRRDRAQPNLSHPTPKSQGAQGPSPELHDDCAATFAEYPRLDYQQYCGRSPGADKSLSLHNAHATIQHHLNKQGCLPINRRQILGLGLKLASQLPESFEDSVHVVSNLSANGKQTRSPSIELLAWMVKGTSLILGIVQAIRVDNSNSLPRYQGGELWLVC